MYMTISEKRIIYSCYADALKGQKISAPHEAQRNVGS
ncbi:hypothetical protein Barb4_02195 [Bacteroidales bacterium Barb4]|nr:hypothetical protein Barb4_02195 [Bacteroidales bacterium Barb4]